MPKMNLGRRHRPRAGRPKGLKKITFSTKLEPHVLKAFVKSCRDHNVTQSQALDIAIRRFLSVADGVNL